MTKHSPGHMHHVVERDLLLCFIDFVLYVEDYLMYYWPFKRGSITKTRLFKYTENFTSKNWQISDKKNSDMFHISGQNIDCGYSLEARRF